MNFEVKVKYLKLDPKTGKRKKATEVHMIDAATFGDAETRAYEALESLIAGEFIIKTITPSKVADVHETEGANFYKVFLVYDNPETEKKVKLVCLLRADNPADACLLALQIYGEKSVVDFEAVSAAKSNIIEFHPRLPEKEYSEVKTEAMQEIENATEPTDDFKLLPWVAYANETPITPPNVV